MPVNEYKQLFDYRDLSTSGFEAMDYLEVFNIARQRPRMLGLDDSFLAATAFVAGCDAGNSWRLLDGFSEWLATNLEDGANLSWQALVIRHALPNFPQKYPAEPLGDEENVAAVEALFSLLAEFWDTREKDGLAEIFSRFSEVFGGR
ncbi:hypothetical protein [Spongiactinospora rosea]|uniref:hypothetical protein n=1 Tax=Spongiactinospora rosea TaxID=2248750 RepID=UPI0011C06C51|nr:hypothetical protein [Spongiactinospora rosea]